MISRWNEKIPLKQCQWKCVFEFEAMLIYHFLQLLLKQIKSDKCIMAWKYSNKSNWYKFKRENQIKIVFKLNVSVSLCKWFLCKFDVVHFFSLFFELIISTVKMFALTKLLCDAHWALKLMINFSIERFFSINFH